MAYSDLVLSLNPVAYYRLGETTGTTVADETGNYNGTYVGTPTLGTTGLLVNDPNTSVNFASTDSFNASMPVSDIDALNTGNAISISLLFNSTDSSGISAEIIIGFAKNQYEGFAIARGYSGSNSNNAPSILHNIGIGNRKWYGLHNSSVNVFDGITHHIVATYDGSTYTIYVDSAVVYSGSTTPGSDSVFNNFVGIQAAKGFTGDLFGTIDEAAIFNTVLTQQYVTDLYNASKGIVANPTTYAEYAYSLLPIAYYRLGETSGTVAVDETGNYNGTYVGGVTLNVPSLLVNDTGTSVTIDGTSGRVDLPNIPNIVSLSAVFKATTTSNWVAIFAQNNRSIHIVGPVGSMNSYIYVNGVASVYADKAYNDGVPHHIAVSFNGTVTEWWIDGVKQADLNANLFINNAATTTLGSYKYSGLYYPQGIKTIDEVAVFGTPLTAQDVTNLYNFSKGITDNPTTYAESVYNLLPVAYYRLGETTGTVAKDEIGAHTGTYGGPVVLGSTGLVTNDSNTGIEINGNGQYLSVPSMPSVKTVSVIIKLNNYSTGPYGLNTVLGFDGNGAGGPSIYQGKFKMWTGNRYLSGSISPQLNTTYHMVYVYGATSLKWYINGALDYTGPMLVVGNLISFGQHPFSSDALYGTLDEVAVFGTELTEAQIQDLYRAKMGYPTSPPVTYEEHIIHLLPTAYYKLDELSGTVAVDETGNYPGTYTGGVTLNQAGLVNNGTSALFDGSTGHLLTVTNLLQSLPLPISATFRVDVLAPGNAIVANYPGATANRFLLYTSDTGMGLFHGTAGYVFTSYAPVVGQTYNMVATIDDLGNVKLYVDGVLEATGTNVNAIDTSNTIIGKSTYTGYEYPFAGIIDEVAIYPVALNTYNVLNLYNAYKGLPVKKDYPSTMVSLSPVAYWRLGESTGTVAIDEMGNHNGVYTNTPTLAQQGLLVSDTDTSVNFTPYNSSVTGFSVPSGTQYTVTGIFKLDSYNGYQDIFQGGNIGVYISNDTFRYYTYNGGSQLFVQGPVVSLNTTYHYVVTVNATGIATIYINGEKINTAPNMGTPITFTTIGASIPSEGFSGSIDEISIFNRVITSDEVAALYLSSQGVKVITIDTTLDATLEGVTSNIVSRAFNVITAVPGAILDAVTSNVSMVRVIDTSINYQIGSVSSSVDVVRVISASSLVALEDIRSNINVAKVISADVNYVLDDVVSEISVVPFEVVRTETHATLEDATSNISVITWTKVRSTIDTILADVLPDINAIIFPPITGSLQATTLEIPGNQLNVTTLADASTIIEEVGDKTALLSQPDSHVTVSEQPAVVSEVMYPLLESTISSDVIAETITIGERQIGTAVPTTAARSSAAGGGGLFIYDVTPQSTGLVSTKIWETGTIPAERVILESTTDTDNTLVHVFVEGDSTIYTPTVTVNDIPVDNLVQDTYDKRTYTGSVLLTITDTTLVTAATSTGLTATTTIYRAAAGSEITDIQFGLYPGSQTELKSGDIIDITITTDVTASEVTVYTFGAVVGKTIPVVNGTATSSFTVSGTSGAQSVKAYATNSFGTSGSDFTSVSTVTLNQSYPVIDPIVVGYPIGQSAIKGTEQATLTSAITNYDTVQYTTSAQLTLTGAGNAYGITKSVTRSSGDYVVTGSNYTVSATKLSNNTTTVRSVLVKLVNIEPTAYISIDGSPSRLRSKLPSGKIYTVRVVPNQQVISVDTISADKGAIGSLLSSYLGYTATLTVYDNTARGTGTFSGLTITGLSGIQGTVITSGSTYTIGGVELRNIVFGIVSSHEPIGTTVGTFSKTRLRLAGTTSWFTRRSDTTDFVDGFTITNSSGIFDPNGTHVFLTSTALVGSNSSGTLQVEFEETV